MHAAGFNMDDQSQKMRSENRIDKENRNQDGTLKEEMQSERSKDQRDRFSREDNQFPVGSKPSCESYMYIAV